MKKWILLSCVLGLFSTPVWSQRYFGLGVSYHHAHVSYKEPALMSETGVLRGPGVDLQIKPVDWLVFNFQGKWLSGNLEYDGATFSGIPLSQTTKDKITEYRGLMSLKYSNFSSYIGYGQRYWYNDLVISYRRETTYHYMPIGFRYVWRPFFISYESRQFLDGLNKSYMSDVGGGRSDVTMKQKKGQGYALEAGFLTHVYSMDLKLSFGYEYWQIDASETSFDGVNNLVEPHNSTNTYTINAGIYF